MENETVKIVEITMEGVAYTVSRGEKTIYCVFGSKAPQTLFKMLKPGAEILLSWFRKYEKDGYLVYANTEPLEWGDLEALLYSKGDYDKIIEIYTAFIEESTGAILENEYRASLEKQPRHPELRIGGFGDDLDHFYLVRGDAFLATGKYRLAIADYQKLIETAESSHSADNIPLPDIYRSLGAAMEKEGGYGKAIIDFYCNYDFPDPYQFAYDCYYSECLAKAKAFLQDDDFEKAIKLCLEKIIPYEDEWGDLTAGSILLSKAHYRAAKKYYYKAVARRFNSLKDYNYVEGKDHPNIDTASLYEKFTDEWYNEYYNLSSRQRRHLEKEGEEWEFDAHSYAEHKIEEILGKEDNITASQAFGPGLDPELDALFGKSDNKCENQEQKHKTGAVDDTEPPDQTDAEPGSVKRTSLSENFADIFGEKPDEKR